MTARPRPGTSDEKPDSIMARLNKAQNDLDDLVALAGIRTLTDAEAVEQDKLKKKFETAGDQMISTLSDEKIVGYITIADAFKLEPKVMARCEAYLMKCETVPLSKKLLLSFRYHLEILKERCRKKVQLMGKEERVNLFEEARSHQEFQDLTASQMRDYYNLTFTAWKDSN